MPGRPLSIFTADSAIESACREAAEKAGEQAVTEALTQEMERDERVIIMGEDVAGGAGAPGEQDAWGGVLGVTKGLYGKFGPNRVLDTPITESAFIGAAVGAATAGLRPVAELMFVDFMGVVDEVSQERAKVKVLVSFFGRETPVELDFLQVERV